MSSSFMPGRVKKYIYSMCGSTGFLVLSRLAEEPALRQRLGENGCRAYEASYDWQLMSQRLLALYADLIRKNLR